MHRIILTSLLVFSLSQLLGQKILETDLGQLNEYQIYKAQKSDLTAENYFVRHATQMGLSSDDKMVLKRKEKGKNGYMHYRYNHFYKEVPVAGSQYLIHTSDGSVVSTNGNYLPKIEMDVTPSLSAEQSLKFAMEDMQAEQYAWEYDGNRGYVQRPVPELIIVDKAFPIISGQYHLCYHIELKSEVPQKAISYYIDAHTGIVLAKINEHQGHSVPGSGKTKYLGEQSFTVDSISPNEFVLRDLSRSKTGLKVFNQFPGIEYTSQSNYFDLQNEDLDEVAVDAHYLTSKYYDILRDKFDWTGLDNNDLAMEVIVHERKGENYINAFWDGTYAHFGDGDCNHGPLVTAEVLAHEFMHGIIDYTSDLIYAEESGAINESLCDVVGHYIEYVLDQENFSWDLGNSFHLADGLDPFRVMDDPNVAGDPAFYLGDFWIDGAGVHTNSSIGNLLFVLLSDGKTGINELGENFLVEAIGIETAAQFLFYVNRMYLNPFSNYSEYAEVSLLAADEYFSGDQRMIENVEEAWKAVGLLREKPADLFNLMMTSSSQRRSCDWGAYATSILRIKNEGSLPYLAENEGTVSISSFEADIDVEFRLPEDIMPNETYVMTIDSLFRLENDRIDVNYQLKVGDETRGNMLLDRFITTEHIADDLSLETKVLLRDCETNERELEFTITNESCTTLESGSEVTISIADDADSSVVYTETFSVPNPLSPRRRWTFSKKMMLGDEQVSFYTVTLLSQGDRKMEDNESSIIVVITEDITSDYFNGFDSQLNLIDKIETRSIGISENLYRYQNDSKFMATGSLEEARGPLCVDADRNWEFDEANVFGVVTAEISSCLDLEEMAGPKMVFDLHQFRNDFDKFASDESCVLRIVGNHNGEEFVHLIQGQDEDDSVFHNVSLPPYYKGSLKLQFLTQTGTSEFGSDFLLYDVMLLNNLILFDDGVDVSDQPEESQIKIYPNPATDKIFIQSTTSLDSYRIFDLKGQLVKEVSDVNNKFIIVELADLNAGFYSLVGLGNKGQQTQQRFVKVD